MTLTLPEGEFKAYLFDCDGTIVDSMPAHYVAWKATLDEYGASFPEKLFYEWGGRPIVEIIETLNRQQGLEMSAEEVGKRKETMYYELAHEVKGVPEVLEHIVASHGTIPFAVVSGGDRESVTHSLTSLGIFDKFETLVCAGDYVNGKPHPEPYLMAAERLGVAPGDCLVFEDTDLGIAAATAAGMASVRILQPWERKARDQE